MMTLAWVAAILLVAALFGYTKIASQRALASTFAGHEMAFIGTSLMRDAVPNADDGRTAQKFFSDTFIRLGIPSAREGQLLSLARAAVSARVKTLYIEVNPLVTRLAGRNPGCGSHYKLERISYDIKGFAKPALLERDFPQRYLQDSREQAPREPDLERIAASYPLQFPPLCHEAAWQELSTKARGTQIILVAMPRAPVAREHIGSVDMARFHRAAAALAERLGVQLFVVDPQGTWESDLFKDQAHVNARGSARFIDALAAWQGAQS
ncbi:hypothetical protein [Sedimentimonas flavescens]|uniref:hypothetical protein n=1 Tax=Sedimentimonas flavescens TaxID=2851012 RepID=UPI0021A9362E|nr:hypothetical protein [Sedimentimonas flavescens]MCT2541092.1 hypothetical protein [Sedimentimonas flavescens]